MPNMTLSFDEELFKKMKAHSDIRWSEVARRAIEDRLIRLEMLERLDEIASKSKLTEKDALEIGKKINRGIARRHAELGFGSSSTRT